MSALTVVYDACVLYPAPIRDLLIRLALTGMFHARWKSHRNDSEANSPAGFLAKIHPPCCMKIRPHLVGGSDRAGVRRWIHAP